MPWIISNGKSYVEIIGNNQMITTAYIDRAHTFNNKKTAEKYCSLLPKAMKNLKYKVIFISNPNPENPDLQLELLTPEFYLTRLKNFSDFILEQRPERFVENNPSARIVGTRSRDYAPRALPELFEWENEGQTNISVS